MTYANEFSDEHTIWTAYEIHQGRSKKALARYISRFTRHGFCSASEAFRIASRAKTAGEFIHYYQNNEFWQDCHNDCEVL